MAHFVQTGDGPVLIGTGDGTLACRCGHELVRGFAAERFLAIEMQCARCGTITATDGLTAGDLPPRSAIVAAESDVPRDGAMTVPGDLTLVGEAEMVRLRGLFQPADADNRYLVAPALLDEAEAVFARHAGAALPISAPPSTHALGWAVGHLRSVMASAAWTDPQAPQLQDAPTANAVTHVTGFLHFVATWSRHPLFPAMFGAAADRGCSLHALAPFATAHCLTMLGNRTSFADPTGDPPRVDGLLVSTGSGDAATVAVETFDRFEFPAGQAWDHATLRAAVSEALERAQARINLRHPGILVLSPGAALAGFDEGLIEAIKASVLALGRRNRGLMAVAPIVLRLQGLADPHAVKFGYGFFPIPNRHYRGNNLIAATT